MPGECGALWAPQVPSRRFRGSMVLLQQRRPGGIGGVARRLQDLLVAAGEVDGVERRPGISPWIAEEHDYASVRGPGRAFVVIALGQDALARSVRSHDADGELRFRLLGE